MGLGMMLDVVRFEIARSMTRGRIGIWILLAGFPVVLFSLLNATGISTQRDTWTLWLYAFIVEIICQLGLLLWATPAISTEIENQTWIYLAMRRSGRTVVFLGKYLTAVLWTVSSAIASLTVCMMIIPGIGDFGIWTVLAALAVLSCFAHAAIFLAIGLIMPRRAMVTAAVYTLIIEYGISMVPAVANKFTVNYRLRSLLFRWTDLDSDLNGLFQSLGDEPTYIHLFLLFTVALVGVSAALFRVRYTQYPTQQDG